MFTGLIEATCTVVSLTRESRGAALLLRGAPAGLASGESVAVNGVCLTVARPAGDVFSCDVLPETLRASALGLLRPGERVNIERALPAGGRLGGHIVNGHVDGVGTVTRVSRAPLGLEIDAGRELSRYIVAKGPVAVDGVSLTVGPDPAAGRFRVFIVAHTWRHTNLSAATPGRKVNIEVDIVAKYVERFVRRGEEPGG